MNIVMAKPIQHLIFECVGGANIENLVYKETVPYIAGDGNQGLPDSYFDGEFVSFVLDDAGFVEWIPACGPAPCWKARYGSFKDHDEMLAAWNVWFTATY